MKYKVQDSDEIIDGEILEKISQDEYRIKIKDNEHILRILNINAGVMEFVMVGLLTSLKFLKVMIMILDCRVGLIY